MQNNFRVIALIRKAYVARIRCLLASFTDEEIQSVSRPVEKSFAVVCKSSVAVIGESTFIQSTGLPF